MLYLFKNVMLFGGVESLVEYWVFVEGLGTRVFDDLLRLSVGIEEVDDLIDDLV